MPDSVVKRFADFVVNKGKVIEETLGRHGPSLMSRRNSGRPRMVRRRLSFAAFSFHGACGL